MFRFCSPRWVAGLDMSAGGKPSDSEEEERVRLHDALSKRPSWNVMECFDEGSLYSSEEAYSYVNGLDDRSDMWFTVSGHQNADCSLPAGWKGKRSTQKTDEFMLMQEAWGKHCEKLREAFAAEGIAPFCEYTQVS